MDDESGESMELIEQLPLQARRQEMKWGGVLFSKKVDLSPQNETKVNQTLLCNLRF